ncbi:HAD-IIA family hydrolase [Cetobacterium sp.]|uniref:HAD-IIA family hydrolase n=1 Tax=Cetobacterium sp. TaxID=2071632 RepID=UPI003EE7E0EF
MKELIEKKLFLLDMDGTIYVENKLIPGAKDFLDILKKQGKDYVFLTNNSSKSVKNYLEKLHSLDIYADESNMFSSGQATSFYLKEMKKKAKLYVVGTESFKNDLAKDGFTIVENIKQEIDYLVVGFDTELNYEKLEKACELIDRNVNYIATNPDLICPIKDGRFIPDCGAICNMLEAATKKTPFYIGKPRKEMVEIVSKLKNIDLKDIAVIGDRLYTDIACGINAGVTSVLVLTGETKKEDVKNTEFVPDFTFDSINDLYQIIK